MANHADSGTHHILRFDVFDRCLHGLLMVSFLFLSATGLPLLLNDATWARSLAAVLGGFVVTGFLHRLFAALLILCFGLHVARVVRRLVVRREFDLLWGPRSLVPQPRDVVQLSQHVRWFLGRGPRPRFDRFTYWEKFDYWAVFWGMGVMGASGLLLWFPEFFARFVSGKLFNVALLLHGEEALLAVGFIFTIHLFNTHLRPEAFPINRVIFTGRVTETELREERPAEFERLRREAGLEALYVDGPSVWLVRFSSIVAAVTVIICLTLIGLILYAVLW